jgi:CubicO group peptidase (beta-lactamase class C family)
MKRYLIVGVICALLLLGCGTFSYSPQLDREARILQFEDGLPLLTPSGILLGGPATLAERMECYHVPGVSIAVISDYEVEWAKGYGVLDAEGSQSVTPSTLFPMASIGKTLTAVLAMQYVQLGLLDLDQNVNDLLTFWRIPENEFTSGEKVTLRRLLSHTAGVSVAGFRGYFQGEEIPTLTQVLDGEAPARNQPVRVEFVPGTQWRYSGGGYEIVEQLVFEATGRPFAAVMQEQVLEPTDMGSTTYVVELPDELQAGAASAHGRWGQPIAGKWLNVPYMAAGGAWTTATDLARFASEFMLSVSGGSDRLLSQETATLMIGAQAEGVPFLGPVPTDWGLGWQLNDLGRERFISHGGDFPEGYQHLLVAAPERGWGIVIMTNGASGDALRMEILYTLAAQYGFLPSLSQIAWLGFLLLLALTLAVVWAVTLLVRRLRHGGYGRKPTGPEGRRRASPTRVLLLTGGITLVAISILFYGSLAVGLGRISGGPAVGAAELEALGKIEQGKLWADHGMIEEAVAAFADAQQLAPEVDITASSWRFLCIRGCVWGYVDVVTDACERAVSLAPGDDGMRFGRALARALTGDYVGASGDLEAYVEWTKDNGFYDPHGMEAEAFIVELRAGRNPFDEAQLDEWR